MKPEIGFIKALWYMREQGYDDFMIYCQAYLETGNFTSRLCQQYNNFTNNYITPDWKGETTAFKDMDDNGVLSPVKAKVYPTPYDFMVDYDKYVEGKFAKAYDDRMDYKKYYTEIMNIGKGSDGKPKAFYPSFCVDINYTKNLIALYERLKRNHELYQVVHGN